MEDYNWSDLEIGDRNLNHSEGYFDLKHSKHEKFIKEELADDKENINKVDTGPSHVQLNIKKEPGIISQPPPQNLLKKALLKNAKQFEEKAVPSVYRYKEIYENKKKQVLNKMMAEEKKKRQFHSRPAPNFKKSSIPEFKPIEVTLPVTPAVLKKSQEVQETRRQKLAEMNKQYKPQRILAREAKVLHEEPFVPKKPLHCVQLQPFNLNVEKRLEKRKQYNEAYNKKVEEKKKQLEEEERIREENLIKELRKLSTVKATPNPFK